MKSLFTELGKPSGTKALVSIAGITATFRMLVADVPIGGVIYFPSLDWAGVSLLVGALGVLYAGRRATEAWQKSKGVADGPA